MFSSNIYGHLFFGGGLLWVLFATAVRINFATTLPKRRVLSSAVSKKRAVTYPLIPYALHQSPPSTIQLASHVRPRPLSSRELLSTGSSCKQTPTPKKVKHGGIVGWDTNGMAGHPRLKNSAKGASCEQIHSR